MAVKPSLRQRFIAAFGVHPQPEKTLHRKNYATFRYGQSITDNDIDGAIHRCDASHFLVKGLPLQAFREGYDLVLSKDDPEPLDWSDAFRESYDLVRSCQIERGYGRVTDLFLQEPSTREYKFHSFKPEHTAIREMDPYGWPEAIDFTLKIGSQWPDIVLPVDKAGLKNVFTTIHRPTDYRWKGRSILEPVWNVLNTRYCLLQSAGIYTARVAAGIKKATLASRGTATADDSNEAKYELGLRGLEAGDTSIILKSYYDPGSQQWVSDELEIDQGSGQFDFLEKLDLCHRALSLNTGIPKNIFDGIFQGSTVGAETIVSQLQSSYRELQAAWIPDILARAARFAEELDYEWTGDIAVEWRPVMTLSDKEQEELFKLQVENQLALLNNGLIEQADAQLALGLEVKAIERPSMFTFDMQGQGDKKEEQEPDKKEKKEEQEQDKEIPLDE